MSIRHYKLVWERSTQKGAHKLTMLALAELTNDNSDECWPSHQTLADMVGVSDRQIRNILTALQKDGEIQILPQRGRTNTNRYTITLENRKPTSGFAETSESKTGSPLPVSEPETGNPLPLLENKTGSPLPVLDHKTGNLASENRKPTSYEPIEPIREKKEGEKSLPPPAFLSQTRQDVARAQQERLMLENYDGIEGKLHTALTNEVKRIYGFDVLIDKQGDADIEKKMRKEAYRLWQIGFGTVDCMKDLRDQWLRHAEKLPDKKPWGNQLYELGLTIASGNGHQKVSTVPEVLDISISI